MDVEIKSLMFRTLAGDIRSSRKFTDDQALLYNIHRKIFKPFAHLCPGLGPFAPYCMSDIKLEMLSTPNFCRKICIITYV